MISPPHPIFIWIDFFQQQTLEIQKSLLLESTHILNLCHPGAPGVAQLVKHSTLAQVMISRLMGSSPASGPVLTARSLEPISDSVSPSLSAPFPVRALFSLKNK